MDVKDLIAWIEAIHQAAMETDNIADLDGLQLWWTDTVEHGPRELLGRVV